MSSSDVLQIMPLGAGQEVGRSCVIIRFKGKTIMLDCGIHPAYRGLTSLPFFDEIQPEDVDLLLVSHFHLDHIGSLPYFTEKTKFRGKVYMTHATKAIGMLLIKDYVRVSNLIDEKMLDDRDLQRCFEKVLVIDFRQEIELQGVKFSCHHAGHVLGGAMFNIEIAGVKILYTGDYSREEDRHLPSAQLPTSRPDILICESTYGKQSHEPLQDREARFTRIVRDIVLRGGRCLLPVFALGRAQELLLILDQFWDMNPELQSIPIYYASALANKSMGVYQTYINMMNSKITRHFPVTNPFKFKHIQNLKSMDHFDDVGPCVMMASPGMLQSGMSRELFEAWCTNDKNGVIIPGYSVDGTLAKTILSNPKEIVAMDGRRLPLRMSVDYISFSAHVDYTQNSQYIREVDSPTLVLVHGEKHEMMRFKNALLQEYADAGKTVDVRTPRNTDKEEFYFKGERVAKLIGSLASSKPSTGALIQGIMVTKDFQSTVMDPNDLSEFTSLTTSVITERLAVPYQAGSASLLQYHLELMFQSVEPVVRKGYIAWRVFDAVDVLMPEKDAGVMLEWTANAMNDSIADAVVATVLQIESVPASIKSLQVLHELEHGHATTVDLPLPGESAAAADVKVKREHPSSDEDAVAGAVDELRAQHRTLELRRLERALREHFDDVALDESAGLLAVTVDGQTAQVHGKTLEVRCDDVAVHKSVAYVLDKIAAALRPL